YGARYYDPVVGQFTQADVLIPNQLHSQDWNRFAYVRNNPISYNDPTGREPCRRFNVSCTPSAGAAAAGSLSTVANRITRSGSSATSSAVDSIVDDFTADPATRNSTSPASADQVIEDFTSGTGSRNPIRDLLAALPDPGASPSGREATDFVTDFTPVTSDVKDAVACIDGFGFNWNTGIDCGAGAAVPVGSAGGFKRIVRWFGFGAKCRSFSADTHVLLADGRTKRIDQVEVGDWVLAADPGTGEQGPRRVTATWPHNDWLIDLRVEGGAVTTTEDHPFWNQSDHQWQESQHFDSGDLLLQADGSTVAVHGLDWATVTYSPAYDLTVDDLHTFFVRVADGAVLVHNACLDLDALSAAGQVADRNGFTAAGRAAQKHGNRGGSFPLSPDKTARGYNDFGQDLLDDLLTAPHSAVQRYHHASYGQVVEVWGPNYGARFGPNNEFIGFLE
ncbi:MAG: polymorphic toxin-type HINT domain-containing protein, partial [Actinomycetota bacterium]